MVKVRTSSLFTSTHGVKLAEPSAHPAEIGAAARRALDRFELDRPVRLVGVRAEMTPPVIDNPR